MNRYELIEVLSSCEENDIAIEVDGTAYEDIEIGHLEECFDGFDSVYPPLLLLKPKQKKDYGDYL